MLRKLRNKIVLTNLIFVGVLLAAVSIGICVFASNSANSKLQSRLNVAIRYVSEAPNMEIKWVFGNNQKRWGEFYTDPESTPDGTVPPLPDGEISQREDNPRGFDGNALPNTIDGAAFAVLLDSEGNIIQKREFFASMDDDMLKAALDKIESSGMSSGIIKIGTDDLAFSKKSTFRGTAIAFTSRAETVKTIKNTVTATICADVVIMVFIALISIRLASLSMKPVQEAWDSQKRFIADASHELKTPLTVILANNSILEAGVSDAKNRQWLESNRYEAERMQKLIEEMLFLAKSDEGGYKLSLGDVNISEIAEHCCLSFETVAFDQGVMIETDIQPDVWINTDASMLEKVFGVLTDNAVKHSPKDANVFFSLKTDARSVRITVTNSGEPIPEENLPHIFERFYKADQSRTADSAKSGFGLGLAIAHDIVEKLGGSISVKSSAEEGTSFTVTLKNS